MNIKITVKSVGIFFENIIIFINVINDNLVSFVIKKKEDYFKENWYGVCYF